jgi:hypothetical protein
MIGSLPVIFCISLTRALASERRPSSLHASRNAGTLIVVGLVLFSAMNLPLVWNVKLIGQILSPLCSGIVQPNAVDQVLESRVAAKKVNAGFNLERCHGVGALRVGFVEP